MANCHGCKARGIARSQAAKDALDPNGKRDEQGLRDVLIRSYPQGLRRKALEDVLEWYALTRAQLEGLN